MLQKRWKWNWRGPDWINANIKCYQGRLGSGYFTFEPKTEWPVKHGNRTHPFAQSQSISHLFCGAALFNSMRPMMKKSHLNTACVRVRDAHLYRHGQWNIPIRLPWNHPHINPEMNKNISGLYLYCVELLLLLFFSALFLCVYVEISVHKNKVLVKWVGGTLWNRNSPKQPTGELCICLRINHCSNCKLMIIVTATKAITAAAAVTTIAKNSTLPKRENESKKTEYL